MPRLSSRRKAGQGASLAAGVGDTGGRVGEGEAITVGGLGCALLGISMGVWAASVVGAAFGVGAGDRVASGVSAQAATASTRSNIRPGNLRTARFLSSNHARTEVRLE